LKSQNPEVLASIEKDLEIIKPFSKEDKHMFIEAATWHDELWLIGMDAFASWHID
jgi:hypothetical protein